MKVFLRAIIFAALAVCLSVVVPATPSVAAEPPLGAVFNSSNPWAISARVRAMILAAPPGSAIRVSLYRLEGTDPNVLSALRDALARGVKVKIVVDYSDRNPAPFNDPGLRALNAEIAGRMTDHRANNPANDSYIIACWEGCIGSQYMHNKFFLFSTMGSKKNVVFMSTSNVDDESSTAWQAAYGVAAPTLYAGFKSYFEDLANQRVNSNYYRTTTDGIYKAYFFPRKTSTSSSSDPTTDTIVGILNNVKCSGNATGVTSTKYTNATMIRIAMWGFTRVEVAKKIRALAGEGCRFDLVLNDAPEEFPTAVRDQLHHANINVDNAYAVPAGFSGPTWMHAKYLLIDGNYLGAGDTKLAFMGSHNLTINALRYNDEYWLKIASGTVHDQFVSNFRTIITTVGDMPGF